MNKRVYVAHTGGTIGMKRTRHGYAPEPGFLEEIIREMPEMRRGELPDVTIQDYDPLLDSANMTPETWMIIARDIANHYDDYDGFLVFHGTDTLAYTSSALPFMLPNLTKPIIITGSQIPLCEVRSDARENIITSLLIASQYQIPEVMVFFGGKLLRGCRTVKVNSHGFDAFDSPNFPPLGLAGIDVEVRADLALLMGEPERLRVHQLDGSVVGTFRLFPGFSTEILEAVLKPPTKGLILESYGVGNGPAASGDFLRVLQEASDRGVVIINCTQCLIGRVNMSSYATGSALLDVGVISGFDMTIEAALAKLCFLLRHGHDVDAIKRQMQFPMRGELTLPGEGSKH